MKAKERKRDRIEKWTFTVQTIVDRYKELGAACTKYLDVGALTPETPLYDSIWRMFDHLLALTDKEDWINWFIYENDCGKKGLEASAKAAMPLRKIKTARDLAKLIVESEDAK